MQYIESQRVYGLSMVSVSLVIDRLRCSRVMSEAGRMACHDGRFFRRFVALCDLRCSGGTFLLGVVLLDRGFCHSH